MWESDPQGPAVSPPPLAVVVTRSKPGRTQNAGYMCTMLVLAQRILAVTRLILEEIIIETTDTTLDARDLRYSRFSGQPDHRPNVGSNLNRCDCARRLVL